MTATSTEFCREYARHRAEEGRAVRGAELKALPYLRSGPLASQWAVRAATFDAFVAHVANPAGSTGPLDILDLGAGNGWLCNRMAQMGHRAVALDIRDDDVDGLGAAKDFLADAPDLFKCVHASFDNLPFDDRSFDIALFNASLHYAKELRCVLAEAARVTRHDGMVAILDSPFYFSEKDGAAMVAEKLATGATRFGARADVLLTPDFIEFLTPERLHTASGTLAWSRRRVRYPFWYEMRPLVSWLRGRRKPSRFDLWTARVP
ncbi:MAG TPA: class I SAM-dependent methyltransferase [Rhizomicrobium sp.]|jgi:SAM-dependent methyltransferase